MIEMLSLEKKTKQNKIQYYLFIDLPAYGEKSSNSNASRVCWKLSLMFANYFLILIWYVRNEGGKTQLGEGKGGWKKFFPYLLYLKLYFPTYYDIY